VLTNQQCQVVYQHDHHYNAFRQDAKAQETAKPAPAKDEKKGKKK